MSKKVIFTDRSNELLTSYLRDISKYKILEGPEIARLVLEAQEGNQQSKNKVVQSNLRFVVTIAKQFQNRGIPLMDLIESGNEGLIKAVDKFDPTRGVTFLSYAVWWIKQAIYKTIYWNGREIRLPMSQQLLVNRILEATNIFLQKNNRNPSSEEIAEMTGIPREQIDYLAQFSNKLVSVDDFIGGDEDNSQVCDIIPDGEPPLEDEVNKQYVSAEIHRCLDKLTIREHDIIIMYFGIGMEAVPPKVIAAMYGVGTERIRQIKEGALNKLERRFGNKLKLL
ncbi:MAG: RNA polymerase sigma factor RpoD/SigA [Bacilli bacterium]|nr:RNA polymerase sigma factor RpoD/SigA [Bacilli bacterium]